MREIAQRERTCRTRYTVLQSTGKQFDKDIYAFLQSIKAKEEGSDLNTSGLNSSQLNNSSAQASQQVNAQKRSLGYNRFDQERYQTKDDTGGFNIDTKQTYQPNGGLSLNPSQGKFLLFVYASKYVRMEFKKIMNINGMTRNQIT